MTDNYQKYEIECEKIRKQNAKLLDEFAFWLQKSNLKEVFLDVKSTSGVFERIIHISYNELLQMQHSDQYDIYRIYSISDNQAYLRIASNLQEWAKIILDILVKLPNGIRSTGICIKPEILAFGSEINISIEDD